MEIDERNIEFLANRISEVILKSPHRFKSPMLFEKIVREAYTTGFNDCRQQVYDLVKILKRFRNNKEEKTR